MQIDRLKRILSYSQKIQGNIQYQVKQFYSVIGMENDREVLNILQVVRSALKKKNYYIFELPFADKEIGALSYKGDTQGYIVMRHIIFFIRRMNLNQRQSLGMIRIMTMNRNMPPIYLLECY